MKQSQSHNDASLSLSSANTESNLDKQTIQFLNQTHSYGGTRSSFSSQRMFSSRHSPQLAPLKPSREYILGDVFNGTNLPPQSGTTHLNYFTHQYPVVPNGPSQPRYNQTKIENESGSSSTSPTLGEMIKRPRRVAKLACVHCRRAHACCDDSRPCSRCLSHGLECKKVEGKKRGRKKKEDESVTQEDAVQKPKKKKYKKNSQSATTENDSLNEETQKNQNMVPQQPAQATTPKQLSSAPCGPLVASSILANNIFSYHSPELQQLTNLLLNSQDTFYFNNNKLATVQTNIPPNSTTNNVQPPNSSRMASFTEMNDLNVLIDESLNQELTPNPPTNQMEDLFRSTSPAHSFLFNANDPNKSSTPILDNKNQSASVPTSSSPSSSSSPHLKLASNIQRVLEESLAVLNDTAINETEQTPARNNNRKAYLDYLKHFVSTTVVQIKESEDDSRQVPNERPTSYSSKDEEINALRNEIGELKREQAVRSNEVAILTAMNETLRNRCVELKTLCNEFDPKREYGDSQQLSQPAEPKSNVNKSDMGRTESLVSSFEELYQLMRNKKEMDSAKFGILVTFPGGRIVIMNQTLLNKLHYQPNDIHDRLQRWEDVVHPQSYQTVVSHLSQLLKMPPAPRKSFKCKIGCRAKEGGQPIEAVLCSTMVGGSNSFIPVFCISFFLFPNTDNSVSEQSESKDKT